MKPKTRLILRNVEIFDRRTSMRLEPEIWKCLECVAQREMCTIHDLCSIIGLNKKEDCSLAGAVRVFLVLYYKAASTEEGHKRAKHGNIKLMQARSNKNIMNDELDFIKIKSFKYENKRLESILKLT